MRDRRPTRKRRESGADPAQVTRPDRCDGFPRAPRAAQPHFHPHQAALGVEGDEVDLALGRPISGGEDLPAVARKPFSDGLLRGPPQLMTGIGHDSVTVWFEQALGELVFVE